MLEALFLTLASLVTVICYKAKQETKDKTYNFNINLKTEHHIHHYFHKGD